MQEAVLQYDDDDDDDDHDHDDDDEDDDDVEPQDDGMLGEDAEESSELSHDPYYQRLFPDDVEESCDMCGVTGMELIDFLDGNGYVCVQCCDVIITAEGQSSQPSVPSAVPEPTAAELLEPEAETNTVETSSDPELEPCEFESNDTKRRRLE